MPNRFYNESFDVVLGTQARSPAVDAQFIGLEDAFDLIEAEIDAIAAATSFLGQPDTPDTFAGNALKLLRCNAAATALEFVAPYLIGITSIGGTSHTLELTNAGRMLVFTSDTAVTVTVPPASSVAFEEGTTLVVCQYGDGQVTIAGGSGVTINSTGGLVATRTQFAQITLIKVGSDQWLVGGDRA